jgi:NADPH:quinone reductase-like Zn-dependent oxidoreductase
MTMMKAVIRQPGGPEVLKSESVRVPVPKRGDVLIPIKAFGLNRSELFTRQGHSPSVKFPRILGIEAVGIVGASSGRAACAFALPPRPRPGVPSRIVHLLRERIDHAPPHGET